MPKSVWQQIAEWQGRHIGLGGIVHEDAHFNFTDFDEISLSQADSEVGEWTNVLEDIRAERLECAKYVGAAAILQRMTSAMIRENLYSPITLSMGCVRVRLAEGGDGIASLGVALRGPSETFTKASQDATADRQCRGGCFQVTSSH